MVRGQKGTHRHICQMTPFYVLHHMHMHRHTHTQTLTHTCTAEYIECHLSLFELTEVINLVLKVFSFRQYRIFRFRLVFMFGSVFAASQKSATIPTHTHAPTHMCTCMMWGMWIVEMIEWKIERDGKRKHQRHCFQIAMHTDLKCIHRHRILSSLNFADEVYKHTMSTAIDRSIDFTIHTCIRAVYARMSIGTQCWCV